MRLRFLPVFLPFFSLFSLAAVGQPGPIPPGCLYGTSGACQVYSTALPTPAAPSAVYTGVAGGTTRYFTVVPVGGLSYGLSSALTTVTNTAVTLDGTHYVTVTTPAVAGAASCDVYDFFGVVLFPNYVGNVACGASIVDSGTYGSPASGSNPFQVVDNSIGVKIPGSLIVQGDLAIGTGVLGASAGVGGTSGNGLLVIAQTSTGTAVGTGSALDPQNFNSSLTIAPLCDQCISQPWNAIFGTTVPSTNTKIIDAVESIYVSHTLRGSGAISTSDLLSTQFLASGSWNGNGSHYNLNALTTWGSSGTVASLFGVSSRIRNNSSGTVTNGYALYGAVQSSGIYTNAYGLQIDAPSGTITNYYGGYIADGSAKGSSLTYGLYVAGSTWKSLFEGALTASTIQTGSTALTLTAGAHGFAKMTASASAPGASGGKIELVCGTNAGTAKLVAYAGTSGTAVTILDNIGAGVTGC